MRCTIRHLLTLVVTTVLLASGSVAAQDPNWKQILPDSSAWVYYVGARPGGELVAETSRGGYFVSRDNGETWHVTDLRRGFRSWVVDATGRIYARGLENEVAVSSDGGSIWTDFYLECGRNEHRVLDVTIRGTDLVAAVQDCGIYRSLDNGASWQQTAAEPRHAHTFVAGTSDQLIAATGDGIWTSDDDGATWIAANDGIPPYVIYEISAAPDNVVLASLSNQLYRASGSSLTFEKVADFGVWRFDVLPSNTIFASAFNVGNFASQALFRSRDGGLTWSDIASDLGEANDVYAADEGIVYAATRGGVFRSSDEGATWSKASRGLTDANVTALELDSDGRVLAVVDGRLRREQVDGSWEVLGPDRVTAVHQAGDILYVGDRDGLHSSYDGGATWHQELSLSSIQDRGHVSAIQPGIGDTLYALSAHVYRKHEYGFLHVSPDRGETWTQRGVSYIGYYESDQNAIDVDSGGTLFLAGSGITYSGDAGVTWQTASAPNASYHSFASCAPHVRYVAAWSHIDNGGVYRSIDGGRTWSRVLNHDDIVITACSGSTVFAASGSGELFLSDDGDSWSQVDWRFGGMPIADVLMAGDHRLLAATRGAGLFESTTILNVSVPDRELPHDEFRVLPNYPNPFSGTTTFPIEMHRSGLVELRVFDLLGRLQRSITVFGTASGEQEVTLDAGGLPSGTYVVEVQLGTETKSRLITVSR